MANQVIRASSAPGRFLREVDPLPIASLCSDAVAAHGGGSQLPCHRASEPRGWGSGYSEQDSRNHKTQIPFTFPTLCSRLGGWGNVIEVTVTDGSATREGIDRGEALHWENVELPERDLETQAAAEKQASLCFRAQGQRAAGSPLTAVCRWIVPSAAVDRQMDSPRSNRTGCLGSRGWCYSDDGQKARLGDLRWTTEDCILDSEEWRLKRSAPAPHLRCTTRTCCCWCLSDDLA